MAVVPPRPRPRQVAAVPPTGYAQVRSRQAEISSEAAGQDGATAAVVFVPSAPRLVLRQLSSAQMGRPLAVAGQAMIWPAALRLTDRLLEGHRDRLQGGARVIELGCGLAMPGMVCAALGADVLLTDKPDVVPYVERRVADNFPGSGGLGAVGSARVAALAWDLESARGLLKEEGGFDLVICSDGVYAPLYGYSSCTSLAEVVHCLCGPSTVAVISFCRRPPQHSEDPNSDDGTDAFMAALEERMHVKRVERETIRLGYSQCSLEVVEARLRVASQGTKRSASSEAEREHGEAKKPNATSDHS